MTPAERDAIRAEAFREAAEIARDIAQNGKGGAPTVWRAIEARAKEKPAAKCKDCGGTGFLWLPTSPEWTKYTCVDCAGSGYQIEARAKEKQP